MRKIEIDERKLNIKKVVIIAIIILLIIGIILMISLYISEKGVRDWVDVHLLRKNLTEEDIEVINLNTDKNNQIHVYSKYIAILNDKAVTLYNVYGEKVTSFNVNINTAIFDSANKYLALAEEKGNEVCLLLDKTYLWSNNVEGEILQVHVNQNGYVIVITTDVTHKSILTLYNPEGKKLFTSYFSSTRIVDATISKDNKYIAVGELDTSGAIIQSNVKILSVENAQKDTDNDIIYTYNADSGNLISNVEYQDKGQISCLYDNSISVINKNNNKELIKIDNEDITFIANDLSNYIAYVEEESTGLFKSASNIHIINSFDEQEIVYKIEDIAKEIYTNDNIIAINVGTELYFVNTKGWLIKKYTANQEITNVMFSENIAAIIYKDKVIIIDL